MTTAIIVQIEDSSNNWQEHTSNCMGGNIELGIKNNRSAVASPGTCTLKMENIGQEFSPDVATTYVDLKRRARVCWYDDTYGYILRVTRTGNGGSGGTSIINSTNNTSLNSGKNPTDAFETDYMQIVEVLYPGKLSQLVTTFNGRTINGNSGVLGGATQNCTLDVYDLNQNTLQMTGSSLANCTYAVAFGTNEMTENASANPQMSEHHKYALLWDGPDSSAGGVNSVHLAVSSTDQYEDGYLARRDTNVSTSAVEWTYLHDNDVVCKIITSAVNTYFYQTVTNSFGNGDVWVLTWEARASTDTRYNKDQVYMVTSAETQAATNYEYTSRWETYTLSFTATASATTIEPRFRGNFDPNGGGTCRAVEYRNFTLKKNGGANVLTNPNFAGGSTSSWATANNDGGTTTIAAIRDYDYLFNGMVSQIRPDPFAYGNRTSIISCSDYISLYQKVAFDLALQTDSTSDQIAQAAIDLITPGKAIGSVFGTGRLTFGAALDRYQKKRDKIWNVFEDVARSEHTRVWVDRDGVLRIPNRDFPALQPSLDPVLELDNTATLAYEADVSRDERNIINKCTLTYYPRETLTAAVLATTQTVMQMPPRNPDGTPGILKVTLNFRDDAGNPIGATNVITPLVNYTDIEVWGYIDPVTGAKSAGDYTPVHTTIWKDTYKVNASDIEITFENYSNNTLYIESGMTVRGSGIVIYDPVTVTEQDVDSIEDFGELAYNKDMPFTSTDYFAQSLAYYMVFRYANPYTEMASFSKANGDTIDSVNVLSLELFDVVSFTDAQTGLSGKKHQIISISYDLSPTVGNSVVMAKFNTERLYDDTFWILQDATYGELGATTRLYI